MRIFLMYRYIARFCGAKEEFSTRTFCGCTDTLSYSAFARFALLSCHKPFPPMFFQCIDFTHYIKRFVAASCIYVSFGKAQNVISCFVGLRICLRDSVKRFLVSALFLPLFLYGFTISMGVYLVCTLFLLFQTTCMVAQSSCFYAFGSWTCHDDASR